MSYFLHSSLVGWRRSPCLSSATIGLASAAMAHLSLLETVGWTGTPAPNDRLGAPNGVEWVDMPSGADRLHLIVLRALRALTGDTVMAANVYLLVAIVAVGLASFTLALDFDSIEQAIRTGAPAKYSWLLAHGLIVTLVWLYIEFLRLFARLRE